MLRKMALKQNESERNDEDKLFLETYGSKVDFLDKTSIKPLIDYVNSLL